MQTLTECETTRNILVLLELAQCSVQDESHHLAVLFEELLLASKQGKGDWVIIWLGANLWFGAGSNKSSKLIDSKHKVTISRSNSK